MVYECDCGKKLSGSCVIAGHKARCPKIASRTQILAKNGISAMKSTLGGAKRLQALHHSSVLPSGGSESQGSKEIGLTKADIALDVCFDTIFRGFSLIKYL